MKIFYDLKLQTEKLRSEWLNLRDKFYFVDERFCLLSPCHVTLAIESMKAAQELLVNSNLLIYDLEKDGARSVYSMLSQGIMGLKENQTTLTKAIHFADSVDIGKSK